MLSFRAMSGLKKRDAIRIKSEPLRGIRHVRPADVKGVSRYLPSSDLEPFIEHYWIVRWDVPGPQIAETMPHPSVHVVLERGASEVVGLMRSRFTRRLEGRGRVLGTRFRPGGFRPFLGAPVATLTDRRLPLADVFGPSSLSFERSALRHDDDREAVTVVEELLRTFRPVADDAMTLAVRI